MKRLARSLVVLVGLSVAGVASAWDVVSTQYVVNVDVAEQGNYPFRVYFDEPLCDGVNWGFVSDADANYRVFVAVLMTARVTNSLVTIYMNRDAPGRCRIGFVTLSN